MIILSKVLKESNQFKILAIKVAAKRTLDNALLLIRVPWQVLVKQVDRRASMYGEFFYLKHGWHDTYQQLDLLPVFIPHNRLILLELLLSISC